MKPQLPDTAVCLQCGYSLRGLPEPRCPECGRAFDPADPRTFGPRSSTRWFQGWDAPPPQWQAYVLALFSILPIVYFSSPVRLAAAWPRHRSFGESVLLLASVLLPTVLGLGYCIRVIAILDSRRRSGVPPSGLSRGGWRQWVVTPVCILLLAAAPPMTCFWPCYLRFHLSRPALEREAKACLEGSPRLKEGRWIGLYYVKRTAARGSGAAVFEIEPGSAGVDAVGFVYDPRNPPPHGYRQCIATDWYVDTW
jgi:hypothetical protein